jgi:uncharacterized lipoprotein YmbA
MMHNRNSLSPKTLAAAALVASLLAACGSSPPATFYTLASPANSAPAVRTASQGPQTFIEVMPVAVPDRLARPQLVVRSDADLLRLSAALLPVMFGLLMLFALVVWPWMILSMSAV